MRTGILCKLNKEICANEKQVAVRLFSLFEKCLYFIQRL